ncbi:unnamed protein product [Cunninghamella echinulata]
MAEKPFFHKNALFFLLLFFNIIININGQENSPKGRVSPGCVLIKTKIYCFGGFTEYKLADIRRPFYQSALNEHITLDLQSLGTNLSQYNQSNVQWKHVSNTFNGVSLINYGQPATIGLSDDSYIMYGGTYTSSINNPNLTFPFLHYNPSTDSWSQLPLMPSGAYSTRTQLVNRGDDSIWVWGGSLASTGYQYTFDYGIFNYKTKSWSNMQIYTAAITADHTATLASNGLIYIIGGYYKPNATDDWYAANFNRIFTYDTQKSLWTDVDTAGQFPTERGLHTTTATADGKYLLIYGGAKVLDTGLSVPNDVYYIFHINSNSYTTVALPKNELSPNGNNARFGHFAALYNSTYLILSFGYRDTSVPAESLSILNVADPTKPVWATALSEPDTPKDNGDGGNGLDSKILIPATVVPVVVVLLGTAVGLFFFIRHRKQQHKNAFVLEQEDPRRRDSNPLDFMDTATTATAINTNSLGRKSADVTKPFMVESIITKNGSHISNTNSQQKPQKIERFDKEVTKPFDAGQ